MRSYISIDWAMLDWGKNNHTDFDLNRVLRMFSQWQTEGKIFETYDYAHGRGLVNWRWCEPRFSTLTPMEGDTTGKIFHCEEGFVQLISPGDESHPPRVLKFDPQSQAAGSELEVISFVSHWQPAKTRPAVVCCLSRSCQRTCGLEKINEQIPHDFSLPEWQSKLNATIADLPYVKTHSPK